MNYKQAVDYIFSYMDYEAVPRLPHNEINYDLRRVLELLERLDNPQLKAKSIHIAGTNGKGSTAAMIASVLTASGYRTGLYTSPHLINLRERIKIDGEMISKKELAALVEKARPQVEAVNARAAYGRLTTFELLTTLAFAHFAQKKADFQVLEVGMGGKFDATNVITPEVAIITSISYDHREVLGDTLGEIAGEKAGIIKHGGTVVTCDQSPEAAAVIEQTCIIRGARMVNAGEAIAVRRQGFDLGGQDLAIKGRLGNYGARIPLLGDFQLENAGVAVATLEVLREKGFNITAESISSGLAATHWLCRLQVLHSKPLVVIDGGHNPGAAQNMARSLRQFFTFKRAILVTGICADKDVASVVSALWPAFNLVITTRSRNQRSVAPELLAAQFSRYGVTVQVAKDVATGLSMAKSLAGEDDLICVAGSLFVAGEALEYIDHIFSRGKRH